MNWVQIVKTILGTILGEMLNPKPLGDGTIPPDLQPPKPTPPPPQIPVKTNPPIPRLPPAPNRPIQRPRPAPTGEPFPLPPPRKLPPASSGTGQRSVTFTSYVSETLATRTYGCMLYNPVTSKELVVYVCDGSAVYTDINNNHENDVRSFIAWLVYNTDNLLEELEKYPQLKLLIEGLGLGDGLESYLANKFCQLAYVGLNVVTRGRASRIVSNTLFLAGCEAIAKIALNWAIRSDQGIASLPLVTHTYTKIRVLPCPDNTSITPSPDLPKEIVFDDECPPDDCTAVLMPDPTTTSNRGKYLVLYWVLQSDPSYKTYVSTWQIPKPKQDIWDVLDSNGKLIPSRANPIWGKYFAGLTKKMGYQYARYYAAEYNQAVFRGYFASKGEAEKVFERVMEMTDLTPREKAPITFSTSEKEETIRELAHDGETLILRKAVVIDKKPWLDTAKCIVTYQDSKEF